ncbi:MAG: effector-associated constant component EACC1 [Catenulispora sp.]
MDVRISLDGTIADREALWDWLGREPRLRGRLTTVAAPPAEGTLGPSTELVVALTTSATGTLAVLIQSVRDWMIERIRQEQQPVTFTLGRDGVGEFTISAGDAGDVERLARLAAEALGLPKAESGSGPGPGPGPGEGGE